MITLLVPTMNRSEFVLRLLGYYADTRFKGRIIIGDSSRPDHVERIQYAVAAHKNQIDVAFHHMPGFSMGACYKALSQMVETPYVAPLPDDDFLIPSSMDRCVDFLEKNSDYVAAHGYGMSFLLDVPGPLGPLAKTGTYSQLPYEQETGAQRLRSFFHGYSVTVFSIHRTPAWKIMWDASDQVKDVPLASEILPCALSVIQGKIKQLPVLYLARQMHDQRYLTKDRFETITSAVWHDSVHLSMDRMIEQLQRIDGLSREQAHAVVKREFWYYLSAMLMESWKKTHAPKKLGVARSLLAKSPAFVKEAVALSRSFSSTGAYSLRALRGKSSPWHKEFAAIDRAVVDKSAVRH